MKKRLLSLILCICLTVSLIPSAPASADGYVAEVDGTQYYYFTEALTALSTSKSHTIKLLADCVSDNEYGDDAICGNVIIDLNGKTLSSPLYINSGNSLTIEDSSGTNSNPQGNIFNASEGTLRIIGGTYSFNPAGYVPTGYDITQVEEKKFIVSETQSKDSSSTVTETTTTYVCRIGTTDYETLEDALDDVVPGQTIEIISDISLSDMVSIETAGIIIDTGTYRISDNRDDISFDVRANVTFSGNGTVENNTTEESIFSVAKNTTLTIMSGTFLSNEECLFALSSNKTSHVILYGGTFCEDVSNYVASGYECIYNEETGRYTVQEEPSYVCKIGDTGFTTLYNAVAAVENDETIELISDVNLSAVLISDKTGISYTIDTAGHVISSSCIKITSGAVSFNNSTDDGAISSNIECGGGSVSVDGGLISGTLTCNSGKIDITGGTVRTIFGNTGTIEVSGGTIDNTFSCTDAATSITGGTVNCLIDAHGIGSIVISGGSVSSLKCNTTGAVRISGGAVGSVTCFTGVVAIIDGTVNAVTCNDGEVNISGGEISGPVCCGKGTITVTNGKFRGEFTHDGTGSITLQGGYYTNPQSSDIIANGYECVASTRYSGFGYTVRQIVSDAVCAIGERRFSSLAAAYVEANDGDTITLLRHVTGGVLSQPIAKSINIDIGIYDFTFASGSNATVAPGTTVSLTGSGGTIKRTIGVAVINNGNATISGNVNIFGGSGSIQNTSGASFTISTTGTISGVLESEGTLNISSGTFSSAISSNGSATISGGTFSAEAEFHGNTTVTGGTFSSGANVDFAGTDAATRFNISGGTFYASGNYRTAITKGTATITDGMFYNIIASGNRTGSHDEQGVVIDDYDTNVTISGGTVINGTVNNGLVVVEGGSYSTAFTVSGGLTAITGGEFNGADMNIYNTPTVYITGGSFSNGNFIVHTGASASKLKITGGNYDQNVGAYCYSGYICEQHSDRRYYVVPATGDAAAIGGNTYSTIAAAVSAVADGQTITLLKNSVLSADLQLGKAGASYILDMSGCVIDWNCSSAPTCYVSSGTVEIYNGGINCNLTVNGGDVTIPGGKYKGTVSCTSGSLGITGGYFNSSVSDYVVSPYQQYINTDSENYTYIVGDESLFVAKITRGGEDLKYQTLSGAVDAAQSGETVYMIKDVSISESLTIKSYKNFILDLGSHTLTGTYSKGSSAEAVVLSKNSSVTIQNGNIVSDIGAGTIVTKQTIITNRGDITLNNVNLSAVGVKNPIDCIFNYGTLVMTNSTLTVNNAYSNVWGIYSINSNAHATLTNSTLNLSTDPSSSTITCQGMTDSYSSNYTLTNSTIRISGAGDLHGILKRSSGVITLSGGSVIEVTSNPASSSSNLYGIFNSGSPSVRVDGSQITVNGGKNSRGIEDTRQESTVSILEGSIVSASSYLSTADVRGISKQSDGGKEGKLIVRDSIVNAGNNYGGVVRTVDSWSSIVEMNNATIYAGGASASGYAFYTMNNHEGSTFTNTKIFGLSNTKAISNSQADGQLQINGDDSYYYSPQQGVLTSLIDGKDFGSDDRSVNITAGYYTAMVAGTAIRLYNNASYSTGGYVENGYMCYKLFTPKTYTVTHGDQSTNYTFTHRVVPLPEAMLLDTADNNMQWLEFGTLKEMLELATTGQTVQLLQDVVHTDINYTNGYKDIILDLRGHGVQCSSIEFETAGYITDSSDNDSGYISSVSADGVSVVSGTTNGGNLPVKLSDGYHFYTVALDKRKTYKSPYSEIKYKVCLTGKDFSNACAGLKTLSNDMSGDLQLIYHVEFDDQGKGHVPVYITEDEERTPHTTAEKFDIISSTWLVNHGANGTSLVPMFRFYNLGCIEGFKFVKCSFTIQSGTGYRLTVEFDDTPVESVVTQQN